jgi:acetyltransferase-like isoleucine patch superfamily enzyme
MAEAEIGDRAYIGRFCSIGCARLGDEVMLADHVQILSGGQEHTHSDASLSMQEQPQQYSRVSIGRGAWIGAGAIVMADVGEHAIIGAGAVVNRPIPANCIAVGVPARVTEHSLDDNNMIASRKSNSDGSDSQSIWKTAKRVS